MIKNKENSIDQRILRLIELLIIQNKISYSSDFCKSIGILPQTLTKIKAGITHFTVEHIQLICQIYNVNANWIFGIEKKVFNMPGSIEITEFK